MQDLLSNLPPDDPLVAMVLQDLLREKQMGKLLWVPTPKQNLLLKTPAFETLYGGARGGGKSYALLAIARNNHRRSLILRRNFAQLEGSLIDDSKRFFNTEYYNSTKHVWDFPDHCLIRFGHVQNFDDVYAYDGSQYDLLGIDQLEQFTLPMYQHLFGILRTSDRGQRVRVIGTANPVGEGVDWIVERWAPWLDKQNAFPALPGQIRWYARVEGKEIPREDGKPFYHKGEVIEPRSRTFIPALPIDNPYLNKDYIATLQLYPEPLRSQLLYGLWDAAMQEDPYQVIPRRWVEEAMARWEETNPFPKLPLALGVDVAYGGEDKFVISRCYNTWFDKLIVKMGAEIPDGKTAATLVISTLLREPNKQGNVLIDMWGWGSSAYDQLKDSGYSVVGLNYGATSDAKDRGGNVPFFNKRTEVWWRMREALDPAYGMDIRLPPDDELKADLCAPKWLFKKDKIQVEPKEETRKRIGRSPDKADAVNMAWMLSRQEMFAGTFVIPNREYEIETDA